MRKYSKQTSSSILSNKNEEKIENRSIFVDAPTSKKATRINTVTAGLTSNSLIHQKNAEQVKPHKFSFADYSYSTSSNKLDDSSSKESSLTKRITNAL